MSGHNKWSKIKHKKGVEDAKRSQEFSKISRLITLESKASGGDKDSPGMRTLISKAKAINMPNTNIDKAIARGTGADAKNLLNIEYEAYGPEGCAIIILCLTDNKNRAAAEVRHAVSKNGASVASPGSSMWNFEKAGEEYSAKTKIKLTDDGKEKLEKLTEELLSLEDVQDVITNAE